LHITIESFENLIGFVISDLNEYIEVELEELVNIKAIAINLPIIEISVTFDEVLKEFFALFFIFEGQDLIC